MQKVFECEPQEQQNWCWAAVSASVYRYLHPHEPMKQCEIANEILSKQCCTEPLPKEKNCTAHLQDALKQIGLLKDPTGPQSFDELKAQLDKSLPVCARIQWPQQNQGHFVTIIGYGRTDSGEEWIDVADPYFGYLCVPYEWFCKSYQGIGTWSDSFLLKPPA